MKVTTRLAEEQYRFKDIQQGKTFFGKWNNDGYEVTGLFLKIPTQVRYKGEYMYIDTLCHINALNLGNMDYMWFDQNSIVSLAETEVIVTKIEERYAESED